MVKLSPILGSISCNGDRELLRDDTRRIWTSDILATNSTDLYEDSQPL